MSKAFFCLAIAAVVAVPTSHAGEDGATWAARTSAALPEIQTRGMGKAPASSPGVQWFLSDQPARAVVVLIHGLNSKPSGMDTLASYLSSRRADVLRLSLTGHDADMKTFQHVSRQVWLADVSAAMRLAQARAQKEGVPVYMVAYSLGALVGLDWLDSGMDAQVPCQKMVLFAPPISVSLVKRSVQLLRWFPRLVIPSLNSPEYRAHAGTPVAAYSALFDSLAHVTQGQFVHANIPTLVLIDPDDELVDAAGIEDLIDRYHLDQWTLFHVTTQDSRLPGRKFHHLIIDDRALGSEEWGRVEVLMSDHLGL